MTRSGSNDLHGGAFEFVRNRVFNARNTFSPTQDFLKRNQFGAYGGGPVYLPGYNGRNKTFFFAGWLISTFDDRQETPLTYNWNLTLEREVLPEWMVRAAYVGSSSLYGRTTKQLNPAVYTPGSTLGTDARLLFAPDIGSIDYYTQDRRAHYHSMQLSVTKRFTRGFMVLANYTWSKSIDIYGDFVMPWYFPNGDAMQHGPSDFDHRQRAVLSWVWELPKFKTDNPVVKHVLNGWQWSGNGQYQTGAPFNIKSGRDNSLTGHWRRSNSGCRRR